MKVFVLILSMLGASCTGQPNPANRIEQMHPDKAKPQRSNGGVDFQPDTSIVNILCLDNPAYTLHAMGDIMPLLDADADLPDAYLINKSGNEYIQVIFFPGSEANSFSQFVVGYSSDLSHHASLKPIPFDGFITESGIRLSLSKEDVIAKKGMSYKEQMNSGQQILTYELSDNTSDFLKRYNMPSYITEYWFKDDKLIKYKFGFEYP